MGRLQRIMKALEARVFTADERLPGPRRVARIVLLALRGFIRDEGFHHASALAFDTVLALVPLLVLVIGTLRGLGAYQPFVDSTILPWVDNTFGPSPEGVVTLRDAFLQVLDLGAQADLQAMGVVGTVALLYLVLILLTTVETTLNKIWGARRPRTLVRRAVDYAAILFVLPLGLLLATAVGSSVGDVHVLGPLRAVARQVVAIVAASSVLTFLYLVMPHTRIRFASATLGGLIAGMLWHGGLMAYAVFQIGVTRYNMLYSSFATLPLFLVWIFVSWLVVLFGAEVAAAHQDERAFRWRVREADASAHTRRQLGLHFGAAITGSFVRGELPPTLEQLASEAAVPVRLAESVLSDLVGHGLLLKAERDGHATFVLARDPSATRLSMLLAALDRTDEPTQLVEVSGDPNAQRLHAVLSSLEESVDDAPANLTLSELVAWLEERGSHDAMARGEAPDEESDE